MLARLACALAMLVLPLVVHAQSTDLRIAGTLRPSGTDPAVGYLDLVIENAGPTTAIAYLNIAFPQRPPPACHVFAAAPVGAAWA